jgi:hypothetical protein
MTLVGAGGGNAEDHKYEDNPKSKNRTFGRFDDELAPERILKHTRGGNGEIGDFG